jgi:hypothetical protein
VQAEYTILFSNFTGCAIGISDINWSVKVVSDSEASAIGLAPERARVLNREKGMPPHGIRLADDDLRDLAIIYGEPIPLGDAAAG